MQTIELDFLTESELEYARLDGRYKSEVAEAYRVDMHVLEKWPDVKNQVNGWVWRHLQNGRGLRFTRHFLEDRLRKYVNKRSRCGKYVELFPVEYNKLLDVRSWFRTKTFRVVEVGFNKDRRVCKIGLTCVLKTKERSSFAFLCIGMDRGLKTIYVTPSFKLKKIYHSNVNRVTNLKEFLEN